MIIYECDKCKVTTYDEMEMLFGKHVCVSCKNRLEEYVADYFQPETKPLEKAGRDISDLIKTATETAYDLPPGSIDRDTRQQPIAEARQVAMCLARDITDWSYPYIAERFGKRDHTTVIHAERKVKESYNDCEVFAKMYDGLMESLTY